MQFHLGLEPYVAIVLYIAMIVAFLGSVFRSSIIGIYFLLPLIPLQTIRYRLAEYPLGASVVGVILLGVILGQLREGKPIFRKTPFTGVIVQCTGSSLANTNAGTRSAKNASHDVVPPQRFMMLACLCRCSTVELRCNSFVNPAFGELFAHPNGIADCFGGGSAVANHA